MSAALSQIATEESQPTVHGGHEAKVKQALTRNIGRDLAARAGYLVSRVLIPPFVLARIGLSAYSVWSALFIMVSYVGVTTMGITAVYMKYTAEFTARGETDKVNSLLSTGVFSAGAVCALLFGVMALELHRVLIWLRVPPGLVTEAHATVVIVVAVFLCGVSLSVFECALAGSQKIAEQQGVWVICYLTEMVLIFYLVGTGHGLLGLAWAFLVRTVMSIALTALVAFRMLPWLRISPWRWSSDSLRKLLGFGGVVQISAFLFIGLNTVERAIAGPLIGLTSVGVMDLSDKWPSISGMVADAFCASLLPAASYLKGAWGNKPFSDNLVVPQLYLRGARYMNLATCSFCAFLATAAGPLLSAWLGYPYAASAYLMAIFALQQNVHHLTGPGTSILKGIGRPREELYYYIPNVLVAAVVIPLSRVVLGHWSVAGLGTAVVVATIVSAIFFVAHANAILGVSWWKYLQAVVLPGLVPYLIGASLAVPAWLFAVHGTRLHAIAIVAVIGAGYALVLAIALDRLVLDPDERRWFRSVIWGELSQLFGAFGLGESHERHT
jgi:O-antigen/teichoic acid export membrane protein